MLKRILCLFLCLFMAMPCVLADTEKMDHLPDALLFTQRQTEREYRTATFYTQRMYPKTFQPAVDAEMAALIDEMYTRALPYAPEAPVRFQDPSYLTVGASITRSGTKWLSFLTTARIDHDRTQTYVDFDARVYDMETGRQVTLGDLFAPDSAAWDVLGDAVRTQLNDYFLGVEGDEEKLEALCTKEALAKTPFTLTPVSLRLHYRADALYPEREQLMHVRLFSRDLTEMMTEEAREQTDNSRYKMIALTFDDGVSHYDTAALADQMRLTGANVTFFVVGRTIRDNRDLLSANHDAGNLIASHNYQHVYDGLTEENIHRWKAQFDTELNEAIGIRPIMMRAPGGIEKTYARAGVDMPVIHWSVNPGDAGSDQVDRIIRYVSYNSHDGDIVLMHDLNNHSREYGPRIVENLTERGFLCVTVEELFAAEGKEMLPDTVYLSRDERIE